MSNALESRKWNEELGLNWLAHSDELDLCFNNILDELLRRTAPEKGEIVADIGCGTGETCFRMAQSIGETGHVTGYDVSNPLLVAAEARRAEGNLGNIRFTRGDAQLHRFDQGSVDLVMSRFGVMFFDDPVAAFANIGGALKPGGRMVFAAWAGAEANEWFSVPKSIAETHLGPGEAANPDAPGPMAFRDINRVCGILENAGLTDVRGEEVTLPIHHPGGLDRVVHIAMHVGPAARLMTEKNASDSDRAMIAARISDTFARHVVPDGISVPAAINFFSARRG